MPSGVYDAVVVGGGFYGATIACWLVEHRGFQDVVVVDREASLLSRASYSNQARVHNGYHYPRSFTTAYRSRVNLPRFVRDFSDAVVRDFTKLYAIARRNSKVTARQFERFCREIGAPIQPASLSLSRHFESRVVEAVYLVEEYAFDASRLARWADSALTAAGVERRMSSRVDALRDAGNGLVEIDGVGPAGPFALRSKYVFNCTYSGLNRLAGLGPCTTARLKHEIAEMVLVQMLPGLRELGVTVMDGPFLSAMPFPPRGLHTLTHVRYTPHLGWIDETGIDPYARLDAYPKESRFERMVRDVSRYMPGMREAKRIDSLFEVKTVLVKNEGDDGRPILFERHTKFPNCYSILGGKIDNIYDVLEKLDREPLVRAVHKVELGQDG